MKQLYTSLVRPHLEYGNVVWHPFLKKRNRVTGNNITRMIPALRNLPWRQIVEVRLAVTGSLAYRRLRGDAIETYKYLHGIYNVDSSALLPLADDKGYNHTWQQFEAVKRDCKKSIRANVWFSELLISGTLCRKMWSMPAQWMPSKDISTDTVCRNVSCLMFEEESIMQSKGRRPTEDWRWRWWWWWWS